MKLTSKLLCQDKGPLCGTISRKCDYKLLNATNTGHSDCSVAMKQSQEHYPSSPVQYECLIEQVLQLKLQSFIIAPPADLIYYNQYCAHSVKKLEQRIAAKCPRHKHKAILIRCPLQLNLLTLIYLTPEPEALNQVDYPVHMVLRTCRLFLGDLKWKFNSISHPNENPIILCRNAKISFLFVTGL